MNTNVSKLKVRECVRDLGLGVPEECDVCIHNPSRPARSAGRRPEGEVANIDRRLVPYQGKCKRIRSRIEYM